MELCFFLISVGTLNSQLVKIRAQIMTVMMCRLRCDECFRSSVLPWSQNSLSNIREHCLFGPELLAYTISTKVSRACSYVVCRYRKSLLMTVL